jgi:hypothetical protein
MGKERVGRRRPPLLPPYTKGALRALPASADAALWGRSARGTAGLCHCCLMGKEQRRQHLHRELIIRAVSGGLGYGKGSRWRSCRRFFPGGRDEAAVPPELGMARLAAAGGTSRSKVANRIFLCCRPLRARSHVLGRFLSAGSGPFLVRCKIDTSMDSICHVFATSIKSCGSLD